jgi:hypothetical protein
MDQGRTSTPHGLGSALGTVPVSGTAGTSEGIALTEGEAVGIASAEGMAGDVAEDAEGIASQARPPSLTTPGLYWPRNHILVLDLTFTTPLV